MTFEQRVVSMGLYDKGNGCYFYEDQYGTILYRTLHTLELVNDYEVFESVAVPPLGIFIKHPNGNDFKFVGIVSDKYKFIGNDVLNDTIRGSILQTGNAILHENISFSPNRARMHNEIVVRHETAVPQVGNVYPQIIIRNTYDGTGAQNIGYGLCISRYTNFEDVFTRFSFRNKLGAIAQIHLSNAVSTMTTPFGNYISVFAENIIDLIEANFDNQISPEEMLSTLDLIEEIGKKRRKEVSSVIKEMTGSEDGERINITIWQLFLAITRYSTLETNLNSKVLLESIAERVLIVPDRMLRALDTINEQTRLAA